MNEKENKIYEKPNETFIKIENDEIIQRKRQQKKDKIEIKNIDKI